MQNNNRGDQQDLPTIGQSGTKVQEKFETLFSLFAVCHFKYNSSKPIDDEALDILGTIFCLHSKCINIKHTQHANIINSLTVFHILLNILKKTT